MKELLLLDVFRYRVISGFSYKCYKITVPLHKNPHFRGMSMLSPALNVCTKPRPPFMIYFLQRAFTTPTFQDEHLGNICHHSHDHAGHIPVMVEEVLSVLNPQENQVIIDMTFGSGGHSKEILRRCPLLKQIIALDRDPVAYQLSVDLAKQYRPGQILPLLGTFEDLPSLLLKEEFPPMSIDGILIDAGVSSMQLDKADRGFSLSKDGLLDMRMDGHRKTKQPSAATVVNTLDKKSLYEIIKKYGEEKNALKIAQAIIEARAAFGKIETTKQLAMVVASVYNSPIKKDKLERSTHAATKTFQALRIFVNNELNQLSNGLHVAHHYLRVGGVCAVLSFHSLEDRIVKRHFHGIDLHLPKSLSLSNQQLQNTMKVFDSESLQSIVNRKWLPLQKKVMTVGNEEVAINPRSRSAKLRAAIKCL